MRAEVGKELQALWERTASKRVDVTFDLCIIKRHHALLEIDKHPNPLGLRLEGEADLRICQGGVLAFSIQHKCPVTVAGLERDQPLPIGLLTRHSNVPASLVAHLYFPVGTAEAQSFMSQDAAECVVPLGTIRDIQSLVPMTHPPLVLRHNQLGVGCVWVQGHINWKRDQ